MYRIIVRPRAERQFKKLPKHVQVRVAKMIDSLAADPYIGKKLQGEYAGYWSVRAWPYRIIYTIEKKIVTVTVVTIKHRKDAY